MGGLTAAQDGGDDGGGDGAWAGEGAVPVAWLVRPEDDDVTAADARDTGGFGICRAAAAAAGSSVAAGGVAEPHLVRARAAGKQAAIFTGEQRAAGEIDVVH